jgi:hypothetical protein
MDQVATPRGAKNRHAFVASHGAVQTPLILARPSPEVFLVKGQPAA